MRWIVFFSILLIAGISLGFIPWPVDPGNLTHTLYHSYGDYHIKWENTCPDSVNFHFGIDFAIPSNGSDDVFVIEDGTITHMPEGLNPDDEHFFVICHADTTDQGWMYGHLDNYRVLHTGDPVFINEQLANIHPGVTPVHLHFMRSYDVYSSMDPGLRNPLQSLDPSPTGNFWNFMYVLPCRFLPNQDIGYWETEWTVIDSVYQDTIPRNDLLGAIDIIHGFAVWTDGDVGYLQDFHWASPHMIEWTLMYFNPVSSAWEPLFTRYPYEFDGLIGSSEDWQKYRQLYFLHDAEDMFSGSDGDMFCLTNCGDATGWDGINNIEENCWQTDIKSDLSGPTNNPVLQLTKDGPYQIEVIAYAWDTGVEQPVSINIELHNSSPIVYDTEITDETDAVVWHAKWVVNETLDDLVPEFVILTDELVAPDQILDATVIFTEPMNTSSGTYNITAGKAPVNPIVINLLFNTSTIFV